MNLDREDEIILAIEKLGDLPDSDIKKSLMKQLAENLTILELLEFVVVFEEDRSGQEVDERLLAILSALYEQLGIPLNTPVGQIDKTVSQKMEAIAPLIKELGSLAKKIVDTFDAD